jgi:hypothetical protein
MNTGAQWITLSEALAWLAFGQLFKQEDLIRDLAAVNYSTEKLQALEKGLQELASKAHSGAIKLRGKYVSSADGNGEDALTNNIPAKKHADFRAFDITTGGLRFGFGLLWLPDVGHEAHNDLRHTFASIKRPEHYIDVKVDFATLQKQLGFKHQVQRLI